MWDYLLGEEIRNTRYVILLEVLLVPCRKASGQTFRVWAESFVTHPNLPRKHSIYRHRHEVIQG